MAFLARTFFSIAMLANAIFLLFGGYAYLWRDRFLNGETAGPYWLFTLYNRGAPPLFYAAAGALVLFWVLRLVGGIFRVKTGAGQQRLAVALRLAVLLGGAAAVPACQTDFQTLQTVDFADEQYHLLQRSYANGVSYAVFRCADSGSFYCTAAGQETPWAVLFPPAAPTPLPLATATVVVEGEVILLSPRLPTPTPPAELVVIPIQIGGLPEEQLSLKIGEAWLGIEISGPTPTPPP